MKTSISTALRSVFEAQKARPVCRMCSGVAVAAAGAVADALTAMSHGEGIGIENTPCSAQPYPAILCFVIARREDSEVLSPYNLAERQVKSKSCAVALHLTHLLWTLCWYYSSLREPRIGHQSRGQRVLAVPPRRTPPRGA